MCLAPQNFFTIKKQGPAGGKTLNLPQFSLAKLFIFLVVLLSLFSITKFFDRPICIAGQSILTKTVSSVKGILREEQNLIDIDSVKGALSLCRFHNFQEDIVSRQLLEWQNLILNSISITDQAKLKVVNEFFNRMDYLNDVEHWGEKDYWSTPVEFIICQTGDCEDFSIAKYFTLYAMGVSEEKLSLTYVKALETNAHHMVLTYYSKPGAEPLILDNIVDIAKPASERKDLIPIYSINGTGLWLAEELGRGKLAGSSSQLKLWQDLLERMPEKKI
jgi:predicted transglutaminase-like cysteine proteinase